MMRNRFDQQLEQLHADLITMGACARLRSLQQWMRHQGRRGHGKGRHSRRQQN